jgi:hypothetical protein
MRLCLERVLPPLRERAVKFVLPPIESPADIAVAMKTVASRLAGGAITPGRGQQDGGRRRHLCAGDRDEEFRAVAAVGREHRSSRRSERNQTAGCHNF